MILVPEEKNKTENFAKKQQEKAASFLTRSLALQSEAEQGIPDAPQISATQNRPMMNFNPAMPFTSSMPEGGMETPPSYNVNDLFQGRIEPTEAPVRDAAQMERLSKAAKFNLIAKGLQAVFGVALGAKDNTIPGPYEGGVTQSLMNQMQGLDDRYFKELAEHRDRELRGHLFNIDQQNRADQARLQKMREDAQALREQNRYDEAKELQAEADQYQRGITERELALKEKGLASQESWREKQSQDANRAGKLQTLNAYEAQYDDLYNQWKQASDNYEEERADELKAQMDENMGVRKNLMKQLSGREGFESGGESANEPRDQKPVSIIDTIKSQLDQGGVSYDDAVTSITQQASAMGYDPDAARKRAEEMLKGYKKEAQSTGTSTDQKAKERVVSSKAVEFENQIQTIAEQFGVPMSSLAGLDIRDPDFVEKFNNLVRRNSGEYNPDSPQFIDGKLNYHPEHEGFVKMLKTQHNDLLKAVKQ